MDGKQSVSEAAPACIVEMTKPLNSNISDTKNVSSYHNFTDPLAHDYTNDYSSEYRRNYSTTESWNFVTCCKKPEKTFCLTLGTFVDAWIQKAESWEQSTVECAVISFFTQTEKWFMKDDRLEKSIKYMWILLYHDY